ncbi:hypothetical protein ID866_7885 [Astraeus odoratus]|nr:hypothetical protein ID866_7885 [Astraeus odoratus]
MILTLQDQSFPQGLRHQNTNVRHAQLPGRTPAPTYRHAAPSGPWPWMDFDADFPGFDVPTSTPGETESTWKGYPQNIFRNWTPDQVGRSKMLSSCSSSVCMVSVVDVLDDGGFDEAAAREAPSAYPVGDTNAFWEKSPRPPNVRIRALFVDGLTVEMLKALGTRYNIEPFFFSSSMNWIPSRYQEEVKAGEGDHITVILPFVRTVRHSMTRTSSLTSSASAAFSELFLSEDRKQIIDTQSPLTLQSTGCTIIQDLLAVHMIRDATSTIISYHPDGRTSGERLRSLIQRTGQSVYWSKIFEQTRDPTLLFLTFLWYALYAWDETFEELYKYISWLETQVLGDSDMRLTRELYILEAHLLHYQSFLRDFQKSVEFVCNTSNPAMDAISVSDEERMQSTKILQRESNSLLSEIERLEAQRTLQSNRLKNVMNLAFATVNISDSRHMKRLTEATVRDSAAMKQISYLTMIFLPANFIAAVFGMNVREFIQQPGGPSYPETLPHYIVASVLLTGFTAWLVIALQTHSSFHPFGCSPWRRFAWPVFYIWERLRKPRSKVDGSFS